MLEIAGISSDTEKYEESYGQWRKYNKDAKNTFHILPSGLKEYLPYFDGKAMNLYLFYCLHSKNETGETWYSTKRCAEELGVTSRSINNWNVILEDIGLILRASNNKKSVSTFLLPLSDYVVKEKENIFEFIKKYKENDYKKKTDGKLVCIINLFQWRKNPETDNYDVPYNVIYLGFERKHHYEKMNKTFVVRKHVLIGEDVVEQKLESTNNDFKNKDVYRIDSVEKVRNIFDDEGLEIQEQEGIVFGNLAVSSAINLKREAQEEVIKLLNLICENRERLEEVYVIE